MRNHSSSGSVISNPRFEQATRDVALCYFVWRSKHVPPATGLRNLLFVGKILF